MCHVSEARDARADPAALGWKWKTQNTKTRSLNNYSAADSCPHIVVLIRGKLAGQVARRPKADNQEYAAGSINLFKSHLS